MLSVSLFFMLRVKKPADYLVAGRGLPAFILTGTIVGTCIGTGVVIGASGLAYRHGWAGGAYPIGLGLGTVIAGLAFAVMRRHQFMTLAEEIACYYGGNRIVVEFSNISLFFSQLCWLTVQIMGGAAVLGVVTDFPREICMVMSGFITALISIPGGLKTVVYTDFLQAGILLLGFGCLTCLAFAHDGGFAGIRQAVPPEYLSFLGRESYGTWKVFSLILALALGVIADPGRRLTMYSAGSAAGAKVSMVLAGTVTMAFASVVGVVGMFTYKLNPGLTASDQALPWLVMNVLPPWLAAFMVVAIASAIFSSANGNAAAVGTFFVRHIYPLATGRFPKNPLQTVRRALGAAFVLSTLIGFYTGNIVNFVVKFLPLTLSGLAVIVLVGRFWKRATWQGALAALITTPLVALAIMFLPGRMFIWDNPVLPATLAGFIAHIVTSLLTPRRTSTFEEIVKKMHHERAEIENAGIDGH
jgi:SSS family solute:Na+ symporter